MFSHLIFFHCFLACIVSDEKLTFVLRIASLYALSAPPPLVTSEIPPPQFDYNVPWCGFLRTQLGVLC